ncbi:unnamed protein product [Effrenium voratum]|uniref:Uncharacterized protein n=1 Tax=Effrenium voratum TaxID=2562239 RepID=A0AA36HQ92_9DINO|nr:unnamed protein product [Effrenium voratum]
MSETEARLSPWGQKGVKSIPAPWKIDVCLEPFRANICKSFVLRVKDFLLSYLNHGQKAAEKNTILPCTIVDPSCMRIHEDCSDMFFGACALYSDDDDV